MQQGTINIDITRLTGGVAVAERDVVAVEEPLEIRLCWDDNGALQMKPLAVTMRTPGHDEELGAGFLFTEGIVRKREDIISVQARDNVVTIALSAGMVPDIGKTDRNFYVSSSCGVCGKTSIDAINTVCTSGDEYPYDDTRCGAALLYALMPLLRNEQSLFNETGGIHACALFDTSGKLLLMREDVGRHNALDKLIGAALMDGWLPLERHILLLSGRASFELVQKATMAGIRIVAAVGAPSSLAVQLAEDQNMTLVGFLREQRFNIYSGAQRIVI